MSDFDKSGYEATQATQFRRTAEIIRAMPAFKTALDGYRRGPAVELRCPRDHKLLSIIVDDGTDNRMQVIPVGGRTANHSGPIAEVAEPWRHRFRVCQTAGCPALIEHEGWCATHGGGVLEMIGAVRTKFTCRQCKKEVGIVTTDRLLQLYGLALSVGSSHVPISDTPNSERPRR